MFESTFGHQITTAQTENTYKPYGFVCAGHVTLFKKKRKGEKLWLWPMTTRQRGGNGAWESVEDTGISF